MTSYFEMSIILDFIRQKRMSLRFVTRFVCRGKEEEQEDHESHFLRQQQARQQKETDKERAISARDNSEICSFALCVCIV
jgi:hypothetical protein